MLKLINVYPTINIITHATTKAIVLCYYCDLLNNMVQQILSDILLHKYKLGYKHESLFKLYIIQKAIEKSLQLFKVVVYHKMKKSWLQLSILVHVANL